MSRQLVSSAVGLIALANLGGCGAGKDMSYTVKRAGEPVTIDANWNKPVWAKAPALEVARYMGEKPDHIPKVQAKVLYDDQAIYAIFKVEDRYVRAVAQKHQDRVCSDSCAEFFFVPGEDVTAGYFNIEANCGGTVLFNWQVVPRKGQVPLTQEDLARMTIASSMPKQVDPEIAEPVTWTIEYRVPYDVLRKYQPAFRTPAPGVTWRANFFKCADKTSHPHWLTWNKVNRPKPDFHVPEDFGVLRFE